MHGVGSRRLHVGSSEGASQCAVAGRSRATRGSCSVQHTWDPRSAARSSVPQGNGVGIRPQTAPSASAPVPFSTSFLLSAHSLAERPLTPCRSSFPRPAPPLPLPLPPSPQTAALFGTPCQTPLRFPRSEWPSACLRAHLL
eukprot:2035147-Rhodomonas_salina.3